MDLSPIFISMKTAAVSITVTFFLGLLLAWRVLAVRSGSLQALLDGILTIPLVLPPTVAGFFLLWIFGVKRPLGAFFLEVLGVKIAFSWGATVLAAVTIGLPLMYRSALGAFKQVDPDLLWAGRTLGMGEWELFWRVLLPNALPGVVSGGVVAFARGLGEFGATAMLAGNIPGKTRTLPLAIYSAVAAGDMDTAWVYVAVIVAISLGAVVVMNLAAAREHRNREGES